MIQTLLVDDEPLTVEYLDRFLTGIYGGDIQIHTASNGREAADRLCQFHIDLIISDIRMPVMDGLELAKINQEQKTPAHMILLSGYEDFHYAQSAIKYGVSDYLLKPLNREELALAVQKQIGHVKDSRRQQKTYLQFLAHSDAYWLLIGQNLIAAIAHQENLRLQQYYKISCELNLEEIQTDGAILLLEVDNWCGPCAQLSVREHGVYSMILAQQTNEVMAQAHIPGFSVLEPDGKTMVYLSGEDAFQIQKNARTLYKRALNHFRLQTSMSASGALGRVYSDVLQMDQSYQQARSLLVKRILDGACGLQVGDKGADYGIYTRLHEMATDLYSCVRRGQTAQAQLLLYDYVKRMPDYGKETIGRFGQLLAKLLFSVIPAPEALLLDEAHTLLTQKLRELQAAASETWVEETFQALAVRLCAPLANNTNCSQLIEQAKRFIHENYSEPISLALLAEKLRVSESYLSSLFHKETGESYIKFLTRVRMEKAAELLRTERSLKVYEVSHRVGYFNAKHFNHVFKQWMGVSPNQYQLCYFDQP